MYTYIFKVTRVIDGDTIDGSIDLGFGVKLDHRIRLANIDTPETRTKNKNEKIIGNLAKARVKELMYAADSIVIKTHLDSAGKFGRILGEFFIDDSELSLNQQLITEKLATEYFGTGKRSFDDNVSDGLLIDPSTLNTAV